MANSAPIPSRCDMNPQRFSQYVTRKSLPNAIFEKAKLPAVNLDDNWPCMESLMRLQEMLFTAPKPSSKSAKPASKKPVESSDDDSSSDEEDTKKKPIKAASGRIERILPQHEQAAYLRYFNALNLSVHIEQIVHLATGRVMTAPPVDEIAIFMDKAPTSQKMKLQIAINGLRATAEDFERRIDADFLAKR